MNRTMMKEIYRQQVANPATITTGTIPATYIDASPYEAFAFVLELGATDNTVDMKVVQATAGAGTGSKDVSGAVITQLSGTDDNKQASIEVDTANLDLANGFRYVAVTATIAGTTTASIYFVGYNAKSVPVTQPAAYVEQVTVGG